MIKFALPVKLTALFAKLTHAHIQYTAVLDHNVPGSAVIFC